MYEGAIDILARGGSGNRRFSSGGSGGFEICKALFDISPVSMVVLGGF